MTVTIAIDDLLPFAPDIPEDKAEAMIADALAMARLAAPCIDDEAFVYADAAKAVIRGAILRWHESGQGIISSQTALGFSQTVDTRVPRRTLYWPSEIDQLQKMCTAADASESKAWAYDMLGETTVIHDDTCSLVFGALYCSCGAALTGSFPLWGSE